MHRKWSMTTYSGVEEMWVKEVSDDLMISPHQLPEYIPASFWSYSTIAIYGNTPTFWSSAAHFCTVYPSIEPRLTVRGHQYCPNHPKIFTYAVMSLSRDIHVLPSSCIAYQEKKGGRRLLQKKDSMRALITKLNDMVWWGRPPHHTKTLPRSLIYLSLG